MGFIKTALEKRKKRLAKEKEIKSEAQKIAELEYWKEYRKQEKIKAVRKAKEKARSATKPFSEKIQPLFGSGSLFGPVSPISTTSVKKTKSKRKQVKKKKRKKKRRKGQSTPAKQKRPVLSLGKDWDLELEL